MVYFLPISLNFTSDSWNVLSQLQCEETKSIEKKIASEKLHRGMNTTNCTSKCEIKISTVNFVTDDYSTIDGTRTGEAIRVP